MSKIDLASLVRYVPNFPKPGIKFVDVTPFMANHDAMVQIVDEMVEPFQAGGIDVVCGIESRGFIFGSLIAYKLGVPFVPIRKAGKLPAETISKSYDLEYGQATIEIHKDSIEPGQKVLVVDDLLATGGTMEAACELVEQLGGEVVGCPFLVELTFLPGRKTLEKYNVHALFTVDSEEC